MKVYHVTSIAAADVIEATGFVDATGTYLTENEYSGVWVSDSPLDINDMGGDSSACFEVDISEAKISQYEWVEDAKTYREWLVPAVLLNSHARRLLITEEVDQIVAQTDE